MPPHTPPPLGWVGPALSVLMLLAVAKGPELTEHLPHSGWFWARVNDMFFTSDGVVWCSYIGCGSVVLLALFGPKPVDERAAQLQDEWAVHNKRFKRKGDGRDGAASSTGTLDADDELSDDDDMPPAASATSPAPRRRPAAARRRVVTVATRPCATRVTVVGEASPTAVPIVTYHDVACNSRHCFAALFQRLAAAGGALDPASGGCVIYHIDVPGHEEGAEPLEDRLSVEKLAAQLTEVLAYFELDRPVLFGAGAGADVCMRVAADRPDRVRGLIAAAPSPLAPTLAETWAHWRPLQAMLAATGYSDLTLDALARELFAAKTPTFAWRHFLSTAGGPPCGNVAAYLRAHATRDALGPLRSKALAGVPTLLLVGTGKRFPLGAQTVYEPDASDDVAAFFEAHLDPALSSWVAVNGAGRLLTEDNPATCVMPIAGFVDGVVARGKR